MPFEVLDISGDVGLRVCSSTIEEAFEQAGIGMFSLITDISMVEPKNETTLNITADSKESLLINYLNELIFQFDAYGYTGCKIKISDLTDSMLIAKVYGETFDPSKHTQGLLIKAATYHNLSIKKAEGVFIIDVIFDI